MNSLWQELMYPHGITLKFNILCDQRNLIHILPPLLDV